MTTPSFLETPHGRRIAYHATPGRGPGVVFCGGFRSDMTGTKAVHLEAWAKAAGRAFLRFDYSGHGASSGAFEDGTIGDWAEDAAAALAALTEGPQVLVGSSMGGWIALLLARAAPAPVAGLVTVAAAPDFTDAMWEAMDAGERAQMAEAGRIERPSDYEAPVPITRALIEDGRARRIFDQPLRLAGPVRMLQGTADEDVPQAVALRLLAHAQGADIRLTLVRGADHRFSSPACLALLTQTVEDVMSAAEGTP